MKRIGYLVAGVVLAVSLGAQAEQAVVFWHSQPVRPGETALLQGHAFIENGVGMAVRLERLPDDDASLPPVGASLPDYEPTAALVMPQKSNFEEIYVTLPAGLEQGVFAYRLDADTSGRTSATRYLNKPEIWFVHGNRGDRATAGGWVGVFGNSLSLTPEQPALLALVSQNTVQRVLTARAVDGNRFAQYFDLPTDLAAGNYELYLYNGYGDAHAWSRYIGFDTQPLTSFRVENATWGWENLARQTVLDVDASTHSACLAASGGGYWDDCFKALLETTGANGAVLKLGARTYPMRRSLVLPDNAIVSGAGKTLTLLQWAGVPSECGRNGSNQIVYPRLANAAPQDGVDKSRPLVRGSLARYVNDRPVVATFSLEDLTLDQTSRTLLPDQCVNPVASTTMFPNNGIKRFGTETGNLADDRSGRFERIAVHMPNNASDSVAIKQTPDSQINTAVFWLRSTRNTQVIDSELDGPVGPLFITNNATQGGVSFGTNSYVRLEGNTIRWRYHSFDTDGLKNMVLAHNKFVMLGTETENGFPAVWDIGEVYSSFGNNLRDIYHGHNEYIRDQAGTPGRASLGLTFDGAAGAYNGYALSAQDTTVQLAGPMSQEGTLSGNPTERLEQGAAVQILTGRGAGQWRHLVSPAEPVNNLVVDTPWEVAPDSSSWLTVTDFFGRMIFFDNDYANSPMLQTYFFSHDVIFAENKFGAPGATNPAIAVWSGDHLGAYAANAAGWRLQVLDNAIRHPNFRINGVNNAETVTDTAEIGRLRNLGYSMGYAGPRSRAHVIRNNVAAGSYVFHVDPPSRATGYLVENNVGLAYQGFIIEKSGTPRPAGPMDGFLRNNMGRDEAVHCNPSGGPNCHFTRFSAINDALLPVDMTEVPYNGLTIAYTAPGEFNLARSGLNRGAVGAGTWERVLAFDGITTGDFAQQWGGAVGGASQVWFEVDTRSNAWIRRVVVSPRTDGTNATRDVTVLVSPVPFGSGSLFTERGKPGVYAADLPGLLSAPQEVVIPNGGMSGRYIRVWKASNSLSVAEIEVYGNLQ